MGSGWMRGKGSYPEQAAESAQGSRRAVGQMGTGCLRHDETAFPGDQAHLAAG